MIRVAVVSAFATMGGSEQWILGVMEHAGPDLQWRFVVLQEGSFADELRERGIPVDVVPTGAAPWQIVSSGRRVRQLLASAPPQVIIGNGIKAQLTAMSAARSLHVPTVWVKHDHSFDRWLARPLGRSVTAVVTTASEVGTPTGRRDLVVIEPPRPPEPLSQTEATDVLIDHGWTPTHPTVAMITRLVPYKGVDVAIEALVDAPAWQLLVIGGEDAAAPGEQQRLEDLAANLAVKDRVTFTGPIPQAGRTLTAVDALTVQTRPGGGRNSPDREGFGIVGTEAMLAGIPVVMAGDGPIASRLATPNGPAGLVVAQSDPAATAAALRQLDDEAERLRMGRAGRGAAENHPDDEQVARRMVDVLQRVVG